MLKRLEDESLNSGGTKESLLELDSKLAQFLSDHGSLSSESVKGLGKKRAKDSVAMTLNKMGIVVPYDKETELGYRPLSLNKSKESVIYIFIC